MATATLAKSVINASPIQQKLGFTNSRNLVTSSRSSRKFVVSASVKLTVPAKLEVAAKKVESALNDSEAAKALIGGLFFLLANENSALASQEIAQLAEGDSRPLLLLFILVPALGWVLFNILQPALNQFNKMKASKSMIGALGLGAAGSILMVDNAEAAQEVAQLAADNRPLLLLFVLGPALGWVLFNILKPALNQVNKMRSSKSLIGGLGLGAAGSLLLADNADAAQEVAQLAADNRPLLLLFILVPAIGWVLFNILQPALRQIQNQVDKNAKKK